MKTNNNKVIDLVVLFISKFQNNQLDFSFSCVSFDLIKYIDYIGANFIIIIVVIIYLYIYNVKRIEND